MSNSTSHYFGAYLEIETSPVETYEAQRRCAGGHKVGSTPYCPHCGKQVVRQSVVVMQHPTTVYELLQTDDEQLTSITPPSLYGKKIIAIANTSRAGQWLVVDGAANLEMMDFPTDAEVASLKMALAERYADTIATLRQHPAVVSVTVKAGYVLDTEF